MELIQQQTLAIAAIAQAAALTNQLARTGQADSRAFEGSVHSIFMTDAPDVESIFFDRSYLRLGLTQVIDVFDGDKQPEPEVMRYSAAIVHLQRDLMRKPDVLATVGQRLEQVKKQVAIHGAETHSQVIENLAAIYSDTLSTFRFRIQVNGNPQYLQAAAIAAQIRTLLLAGVRASMLWQQLGGSRFHFLLKRRALLNAAKSLL